jgi:SAM-dependent methyltransferase/predicted O-methyltransferase YrrM
MSPPALLEQIYASGKVEDAAGHEVDAFPAGLPRAHANEIARLVRELGLTSTLETGMAYGLSTLAVCAVHEERGEGSHVAIDPHQTRDWRGIGVLNLERAGLAARARVIEARSDEALPRLRDEGLRIDFALIDGLHLFDATLVDFFHADRMLDVGGVVVFHDTWMPAVAQAVAYVRANRAYEPIEPGEPGLAALRKQADDDRAWDFHRDFGVSRQSLADWLRPRIGTRRRRLETHPLKTRLERDRLGRRSSSRDRERLSAVDPTISPRDAMYAGDGGHYFSVGLSALRCIEEAIAAAGTPTPQRILDMPSGHGRVLRFLRARYPSASAVACDLDEDAIAFCAERFGARPQRSCEDLASLDLPGPFDLIWCGSLVTHLDANANGDLLALFARSLAPGGVAVVTTHGELVAERLRSGAAEAYQLDPSAARDALAAYGAAGFGYADYAWSPGYGVSISSERWIAGAAAAAGLRVAHAIPHGWDGHQDVIALARNPEPPGMFEEA